MNKYEMNLNDKKVFFYHNNEEDIINIFEQILIQEENKYKIIEDNKILQLGFNYYKIEKVKDEFQIYAIDYNKNPFKDFTEDLTQALDIMRNQLLITKKTGLISD